ncbi:DUF6199 family natural product biosynthesis protein [Bacillus sp. AK128]
MMLLGIFLLAFGLFMIIKPSIFWMITEKWKTNDGDDPSGLYIWSTRFGGIMFSLVGISVIITSFWL